MIFFSIFSIHLKFILFKFSLIMSMQKKGENFMNIKKYRLKTMCVALACTTILSSTLAAYATDVIINETPMDDSAGINALSDDSGWTIEENSFEDIKVTYQQSSSYTVTIPKTIALDTNKQATYSVKVSGDIDTNQRVYVAPVDGISDSEELDFYMKDLSAKKADIVATVTHNKTYWNSEEVTAGYEETNNSVSAPNLTAGTWEGTFQMEIRLETENEQEHIHHYVDGICDGCGAIDPDYRADATDFTMSNSNYKMMGFETLEGDIIIPEYFEYDGVTYRTTEITNAFNGNNNVTSITIPKSVSFISNSFLNGTSLESIIVDKDNPYYMSENGILFSKDRKTLLKYPAAKEGETYDIPDGVVEISNTFQDCKNLVSISMSDTVKYTDGAFRRCSNLKDISLSNSLEVIGRDTFEGCTSLEEIELPDSVTTIDYSVFSGCTSLKRIYIPNTVSKIYSAFRNQVAYAPTDTGYRENLPTYSPFYNINASAVIYTGYSAKQSGWETYWNTRMATYSSSTWKVTSSVSVKYNITRDDYQNNYK